MAAPLFVLLTAPTGAFYTHVLRCFAAGFEALGVPCLWQNPAMDIERLSRWVRGFSPAAVLEINRFLPEGLPWPAGTAHIAWLQDHRFGGNDMTRSLGASDHLYFIVHPKSFGIDVPAGRSWSVLVPGARADAPGPAGATTRDFALVGAIPSPLMSDAEVARMPDGRVVTLLEFLQASFPLKILSDAAFSMRDIHQAIADTCARIGCAPMTKPEFLQLFDEILVRTIERQWILESVLKLGGTLEIFGPPHWQQWPQFTPHYRGHVADPRGLDPVFQTTRINLHNSGLTMHFRVMDCLAAGGFMLVNETPWDTLLGGIREYLEPGVHYGAYPVPDVAAVAKRFLDDALARERIAAEGRRIVLAENTWRHRAAQVLRDIGLSPPASADFQHPTLVNARAALDLLRGASSSQASPSFKAAAAPLAAATT